MIDYPEHLNSKEDYLNMLSFDKIETVRRLEMLLSTRFYWVFVKELSEGEEGIEDDTHRVCVETETPVDLDGPSIAKRYQYELQESEYAPIFKLGFRVDEVEQLIKEHSQ
ncbi:hypothetical protein [Bartonella tribocorum]|uniref:Uncharacterized protein n=1 Tax=Bartonella tribocorum (strain DSM 28219 / CCUG 45778 / CIP 105476 / IBS 506) TaxID=382640 RepID=A9IY33_BART1|nr:hypothetical protein [Bartonella tribocorum]CAK02287.1 hypothetical protein predicted by Glimmer/Critica [Bartonella tribocorum CIP 105476]CDO49618.1 hypothetical protein BM1374166_01974 [Bartonella tribocorum]